MTKKAPPSARLINAVPDSPEPQFTYKEWCEGCVAKRICTGCTYPRCNWCLRCDGKRGAGEHGGCDCPVSCKSTLRLDMVLSDTEGLDIAPLRLHQPALELPRYIPIVNPTVPLVRELPAWTYTIPVHTFIRMSDGSAPPMIHRLRERFAPGSQLILNFCCPDNFIDRIWTFKRAWWESSWFDQFDAVMAINYSVYFDDPKYQIMSSIRKTWITAREISAAGHKVIPLVIWYDTKESWEQLDVCEANGVHTVICNFQYVAGAQVAAYKHDLKILEEIAKRHPNLRIICYGISAGWVINEARRILGDNLVVANADAFYGTVRAATNDRGGMFATRLRHYETLVAEGSDAAPPPGAEVDAVESHPDLAAIS